MNDCLVSVFFSYGPAFTSHTLVHKPHWFISTACQDLYITSLKMIQAGKPPLVSVLPVLSHYLMFFLMVSHIFSLIFLHFLALDRLVKCQFELLCGLVYPFVTIIILFKNLVYYFYT